MKFWNNIPLRGKYTVKFWNIIPLGGIYTVKFWNNITLGGKYKDNKSSERFELSTPGLQDHCSNH